MGVLRVEGTMIEVGWRRFFYVGCFMRLGGGCLRWAEVESGWNIPFRLGREFVHRIRHCVAYGMAGLLPS